MSLPEGCDSVEGWEQKRILKYCGEKYKPSCFLLQCKWFLFYFYFGFFLKPNYTKLSILFNLLVGLMVEECLGERKPHQRKTNRSELFEAVHIVGHLRDLCETGSVAFVVLL